jgi:hypothetical protein
MIIELSLMRKQRGQAFAEYHIFFPGAILLAILAVVVLGNGVGSLYDKAIGGVNDALMGNAGPPPEDEPPENWICVTEEDITEQNGGSFCEHEDNCDHIEPRNVDGCSDFNNCAILIEDKPNVFVIKAGRDYQIYIDSENPYTRYTDDGCYKVTYWPETRFISWSPLPDYDGKCRDVSHVQAWHNTHLGKTDGECENWVLE